MRKYREVQQEIRVSSVAFLWRWKLYPQYIYQNFDISWWDERADYFYLFLSGFLTQVGIS